MVGEEEGKELIQPFFHILLSSCPIPLPSSWLIMQLVFLHQRQDLETEATQGSDCQQDNKELVWSELHSRGHMIKGPEWTS